jgi:two-component system chemotaxis response regulator CheB
MEKIRVLVADDSAFMRKLIQDILSTSDQIEIAGTARNGEDATKKVKDLKRDVVTMDIGMPILNRIEALKVIMKETPVPVVRLSSTTQIGADNTLLAIQHGAVDFIAKPSGSISLDLKKIGDEMIEKVLAASKANLHNLSNSSIEKNLLSSEMANCSKIELYTKANWENSTKKIICIGTSTGGPRALQSV